MKKTSLLVLLCVCLLLTACTATDPDNLFETTLGNTEDTAVPNAENTESVPEEVILYTGTYPYGNMQKNLPPGDFVLLGNEVIFLDANDLLHCYDLVTEEVRCYCEDATCKHDYEDEANTCVAAEFTSNLEVYNGKLYGSMWALEEGPTVHHPGVANGNGAEYVLSANATHFFHHEDDLYFRTGDSSFMVLEDGQTEPRMLLEEYTGYWHVIFGDYLYANTQDFNIIRVDLTAEEPKEEVIVSNASGMTDGQHIYYVDDKTSKLYRCDPDGGNAVLLVDQEVLFASMNFDDDYFYYRLYTGRQLNGTADSRDIYRFPKDDPTRIEKIATLPESAYQVFTVPGTGKLFATTHAPEGEDRPTYVMNTDGSGLKKLEIPEP